MHAVSKYLKVHAAPEIRLAGNVPGGYERAVVVPVFREESSFVDGLVEAARTSRGSTLCIVVVNAPEDAPAEAHADNARLIHGLVGRLERVREVAGTPRACLGSAGARFDVLVIDRASEGARLPPKQGVGFARKVGTDVALALHVEGKVASSFVFGTDADVVLPEAHFDLVDAVDRTDAAAVVFPFWHEPAVDPELTRATALYELSLRYYVAGLTWAGSPFAFHTLGSTTAVSAAAYAAVRGYPRREAAEDFYLLNKIAKVGPIARSLGPPIRIRSRLSDRTPFGTGRRVTDTIVSGERGFYAPQIFRALREALRAFDSFAEHAMVEHFFRDIHGFAPEVRSAALELFEDSDARPALEAASREAPTRTARKRRVHSWFDAFRTLKFVHALRDRCFPNVPWRDALDAAPFYEGLPRVDDVTFAAERGAFVAAESRSPRYTGPTL